MYTVEYTRTNQKARLSQCIPLCFL